MTDEFPAGHIHTTPEGRHFRHDDGAEVDGDGEPISTDPDERAIDGGSATAQALEFAVRQFAALRSYLPSTAARVLAESSPNSLPLGAVAVLIGLSRILAERGE